MRDDRLLLPDGEFGNKLRVEPEEVIILPDDA